MAVASFTTDPDILEAKRRRLRERELQAAQLGPATPPEIRIEIQDLSREIAEAQAPGSPAEQYLDLRRLITRIGYIVVANTTAVFILLLLFLVVMSRIVPEPRQAQQPSAAPAPSGLVAPAVVSPTIDWRGTPIGDAQ